MDRHFLFQERTRTGPDGVDRRDWVVTYKQSREAWAAGDDCVTLECASIAEAVDRMQDHLGVPKRNDGELSLLFVPQMTSSCCPGGRAVRHYLYQWTGFRIAGPCDKRETRIKKT